MGPPKAAPSCHVHGIPCSGNYAPVREEESCSTARHMCNLRQNTPYLHSSWCWGRGSPRPRYRARLLLRYRRSDSRALPLRRRFLRMRTVAFCFSLSELSKLSKKVDK